MSTITVTLIETVSRTLVPVENEGSPETAFDVALEVLGEYNDRGDEKYLIENIEIDGKSVEVSE
jgi:hypothetical protein